MTHDVVTFRLQDGRLPSESWVYAVVSATGRVLHVGSTALPVRTRVWLHLSHDDPEVGRLRAEVAPTELADASVVAVPVPSGVDRRAVRDLVRDSLGADELADAGQRSPEAVLRCAGELTGLLRAGTDG